MPQQRRYEDNAAKQRAYRARQAQARREEQQAKGLPPAPPLPTLPGTARWQALLTQARLALETARDEMQAYYEDRVVCGNRRSGRFSIVVMGDPGQHIAPHDTALG